MADLLSYALTDVASVKESLGIETGNTSKDNLIKRKINQATEMIEGFCALPRDHHFKETTYTDEEYDSGTNQIVLRMSPVITFTSLQKRTSSENLDNWDTVETDTYFIDEEAGVIDGNFTFGGRWNRWRVTYTAGYATIPADLAEAAVMLASYLVDNAQSGGAAVKRKQEGQREIEYFPSTQGGSIIEQLGIDDMISKYIRYPISEK